MRSTVGADEVRVPINSNGDIVSARQRGWQLASQSDFSLTDATLVATAISELARNIVRYAGQGEIALRVILHNDKRGIEVVATDDDGGIPDVEVAMRDGYSTSGSLGLGLPGVRRLMDEFEITSEFGKGTTVAAKKWKR